jgi:hypothetical protein
MGAGGALVTVIPLTRERKWTEKAAPGGVAGERRSPQGLELAFGATDHRRGLARPPA